MLTAPIPRLSALSCLLVVSFALSGCATFTIPAPKGSVKPMPELVAESSTISVPISISMTALSGKLDQLFTRNSALNKLNQEKNIKGKIQDFLNSKTASTDADLFDNFYVKMAIARAWDALQNPIKLNYALSLVLNPEAIQIAPAVHKGDTATIIAGLVAKPKLISGDIPNAGRQSPPNFSMVKELRDNGFHIMLDNELSFDFISSELSKRLAGKTYRTQNNTVAIEQIRIYGSGERAVVAVKVKGSTTGTVYLSGIPAYDESAMTISINNLEYTLETKNVLTKAADWLLHTNLRESLADQAKWFIGDKIDTLKDRLSYTLNRKVNRNVSISGKIFHIRPIAVGITDTSLKAVLVADGTVGVRVF